VQEVLVTFSVLRRPKEDQEEDFKNIFKLWNSFLQDIVEIKKKLFFSKEVIRLLR